MSIIIETINIISFVTYLLKYVEGNIKDDITMLISFIINVKTNLTYFSLKEQDDSYIY